jgi:hypothetical protein
MKHKAGKHGNQQKAKESRFHKSVRFLINKITRPLFLQEEPGTHFIEGYVGLGSSPVGKENLTPLGFHPWTLKLLASGYTNCAIPAHSTLICLCEHNDRNT